MKKRFLICCVCLVCLLTMSAFAASPVIVAQPQNYYFPVGTESGTAYFTVLASGDDLSYQWQSSTNGGRTWVNSNAGGSTTNSIYANIGPSLINGVIKFRCIVSNTEGSVTSQVVSASAGTFVLNSLPQFLSFLSETADAIFSWASDCCTTIVSEPLLLFTCGFLALGGCVALVGRLLSRS